MSLHEQRVMRAALLFQQSRFADAERTLRDHLSEDPNDVHALRLLGETLLAQDRPAEARIAAQNALGVSPADGDVHGLLARVELVDENEAKAEDHAQQSVKLDPNDADHWGTLAFVLLRRNEHARALDAADTGLRLHPENLRCLNMRTEALARLGRKEEADVTIGKSLELDPENPYTHSNTGWAVLRRGDHQKALEHFREALRRDPMNDHAKAGLVEALKARYWLYRMFLRYQFWVSNLKSNAQWMLIIGFYAGSRLLRVMSEKYPALAPLIWPLLIAYMLFALSTWVMSPLSNLLLRFNKYGRYALDRDETMASNFTGIALLLALVGGVGFLFTGSTGLLALGILGLVMMIPLASMLNSRKKGRPVLVGLAAVLALLGLAGVALAFRLNELMNPGFTAFLIGAFLYQFIANFVNTRS